jgi:hypothetical protein
MRKVVGLETHQFFATRDGRRSPLQQAVETHNLISKGGAPKNLTGETGHPTFEANVKNILFRKRGDNKVVVHDANSTQRAKVKSQPGTSKRANGLIHLRVQNENEGPVGQPMRSRRLPPGLHFDAKADYTTERCIQTGREVTLDPLVSDSQSDSEDSGSVDSRPPENPQKTEVQVTASFNLLASDIFLECQTEMESVFDKLKSVFRVGAKYFNRQQVAFVLKTTGLLDELDDEFGGTTPEDQLMLNLFYTSLKTGTKGVQESKLKEVICLMKALLKNELFQRRPKRLEKSEVRDTSESSEINPNRSSCEVKNISFARSLTETREKVGLDFGKNRKGIVEPLVRPRNEFLKSRQENRSPVPVEDFRQFSFKKSPEVLPELLELKLAVEDENRKTAKMGTASRNLLDELTECWAKKKAEKIRREESEKEPKGPTAETLVASIRHKRARSWLKLPQLKHNSFSDVESKLRRIRSKTAQNEGRCASLHDIPHCPRRGKFLFSAFIRCGKKINSLMVYENDDLVAAAKTFSDTHGVKLESVAEVFERIAKQKTDFVKSFFI